MARAEAQSEAHHGGVNKKSFTLHGGPSNLANNARSNKPTVCLSSWLLSIPKGCWMQTAFAFTPYSHSVSPGYIRLPSGGQQTFCSVETSGANKIHPSPTSLLLRCRGSIKVVLPTPSTLNSSSTECLSLPKKQTINIKVKLKTNNFCDGMS